MWGGILDFMVWKIMASYFNFDVNYSDYQSIFPLVMFQLILNLRVVKCFQYQFSVSSLVCQHIKPALISKLGCMF